MAIDFTFPPEIDALRLEVRRFVEEIVEHEWYPAIVNTDEFRAVVLEENAVEVAFLAMVVPGVCGMRLESPVCVTPRGGELLCATLPTLTVIDA